MLKKRGNVYVPVIYITCCALFGRRWVVVRRRISGGLIWQTKNDICNCLIFTGL